MSRSELQFSSAAIGYVNGPYIMKSDMQSRLRRSLCMQWMMVADHVVDRMAKFDREAMKKTRLQMTTLKSTGQPKFALEEEVEANVCILHVLSL